VSEGLQVVIVFVVINKTNTDNSELLRYFQHAVESNE